MPRIAACGSRQNEYDSFCTATNYGEEALLLVDSEAAVAASYRKKGKNEGWQPWRHLQKHSGDKWKKPDNAEDLDCHLMVQCMEAWFLADSAVLVRFFGQGFNGNALPAAGNQIESIPKRQIYKSL